jgi:cob(I)alamin adenosyltransferase
MFFSIHRHYDAVAVQAFWVRAICRRAEREVVSLTGLYPNLLVAQRYLNRLSDAFFVFARWLNVRAGQPEIFWEK